MKKQVLKLAVILMFGFFASKAWSSNIQIFERPEIEHAGNFMYITFGLSWDHSWRTVDPNNWDAAWVFIKYRVGSGPWDHMFLDHTFVPTVGNNNGVPMQHEYGASFVPDFGGNRAVGVFLHRAEHGRGNIVWEDVRLRWNRATPGIYHGSNVLATDEITVRVFAIEMVYVPQGPFFVGSGNNTAAVGEFVRADRPSGVAEPFLITSEDAIPIRIRSGLAGFVDIDGVLNNHAGTPRPGGLSVASNVFTSNPSTAAPAANSIGLIGEGEDGIPAAFPKGFRAFYIMKYEITQGAYVDFLNTLTVQQQIARTRNTTEASAATHRAMLQSNASDRNFIKIVRQGIIEFGVDMNNNNIFNEEADGHGVANAMNAFDLMAFLDFSGLRPMTELEFEKAARGPRDPIPNEFAWGSTFWRSQTAQTGPALPAPGQHNAWFIDGGLPTERPIVANVNHMAASQWAVGRNGMFANDSSGRVVSGASYWGVMELSSNLWELTINVINVESRGFTGQHGDGRLSLGGMHNVTGWPMSHFGFGLRGGSAAEAIGIASGHSVSARASAFWNSAVTNTMGGTGNSWNVGGRGVRTAHTHTQL